MELLTKVLIGVHFAKRAYSNELLNKEDIMLSNKRTDAQVLLSTNLNVPGLKMQPFNKQPFDMVVAFRGTESKRDAITDLDIRRTTCNDIIEQNTAFSLVCCGEQMKKNRKVPLVHKGFFNQYMSVRKEVFDYVDRNSKPIIRFNPESGTCIQTFDDSEENTNVLIASHSLGAALGTIAALDLCINRPNLNVTNITFGSPRVGNNAFVALYKNTVKDSVRCVHGNDIVTFIPIPIRFQHVDDCMKFSRVIKYPWWRFAFLRPTTYIKDHDLNCYTQGIMNKIEVESERSGEKVLHPLSLSIPINSSPNVQ